MIIDRKQFSINETCVIEKLLIETPFKYAAVFQNEACFLYIKEGETVVTSPLEQIAIYSTECVLLKCGNYFAHLIQNSKNQNCIVFAIHLHSSILKELYKEEIPSFIHSDNRKNYVEKIEKKDIITHFIASIDFYFNNPTLVTEDIIKLKLKELILLLLQTEENENLFHLFSFLFSPREANFKEIIQAHLFSTISVRDLATLTGHSLSTFKRTFEAHFSNTPANYFKEQKILKARVLLKSTDFSINQICYEVGFNDSSHFTKAFKEKYQVTPSEFRKK